MNTIGRYYDYLFEKLGVSPEDKGMESICALLLLTPFIATITDDENQIERALYMRREFARTLHGPEKQIFYEAMVPCSVLEILVLMVEKMSYMLLGNPLASSEPGALFFELMDNLGLSWINDKAFGTDAEGCNEYFEDIMQSFICRDYAPDGSEGGLFPVKNPADDMRKLSLHRQMEAYLIDRYDALKL